MSIPTVPNPGEINFADKLNQVLNKNKLLQKKTQRMASFAEIKAAFGSKKKTPIQRKKKSPLLPKPKRKEKNLEEDSDESASKIIQRFLERTENQNNQNQNPNNMNNNTMNSNNNLEDKSTDKSGDKSTSDKSVNNINNINNNINNNIDINNNVNNNINNVTQDKKEKIINEQIDNNTRIERLLEKSVTKLEKPKNKESKENKENKQPEPETTETQIDLSVPDPNAPNEIVLEEEIEEEIEDDEENEVEELESSVSEVDLSNIPENENGNASGINLGKNKRLKKGLSTIDSINTINTMSTNVMSNNIPMEIPQANPPPLMTEITPQTIDVNTIMNPVSGIPTINTVTPIINNPSAVNISNISNISNIPTMPNITTMPIITPATNIHDVNSITNNVNLINTINTINEPRKYTKKHNKNLFVMNGGINTINTLGNRIGDEPLPTPPLIQKIDTNIMMQGINKFNQFNSIAIQKHIKETNPEEIEREFYEVMNGQGSPVDRLVFGINFFMDQGFTENVRYVFYENLMNLGLPINGNFNKFYQTFIANCGENQRDIPCKIAAEFYFEFIFKILVDNISEAKQRYISDFFFNGNKYETIRNNFNLITYVRELIAESEINLYNFIIEKYDSLFKDIVINNIKINTGFNKYKSIISKMLANVIIRCDKYGYLNFRQYIDNERIIFDGLKIKDNNMFGHGKFNVKKMISIKVFGQELTNKKFNDIIKEFFLYLFSHFNYADIMKNK
jgi:hypothetical protein